MPTEPERNMYGCLSCQKCGDNHRYGRKVPLEIRCDVCGFVEPGAEPVWEWEDAD